MRIRVLLGVALVALVGLPCVASAEPGETLPARINRVQEDLALLNRFYDIACSEQRRARIDGYATSELQDLDQVPFSTLDRESQVDYLLLKNSLQHLIRQDALAATADAKCDPLVPFRGTLVTLCEARQKMIPAEGEASGATLSKVDDQVVELTKKITEGFTIPQAEALRAARMVESLQGHLGRWYGFYKGYDPLLTWWVEAPYARLAKDMSEYAALIREKLVGVKPGDSRTIVGEPIGREALLEELQAEKIAYTPEELIAIAEKEYAWCEAEMKKASQAMGFGDDWRAALEKVKTEHVAPGEQPALIRRLALEAIDYVKKNDLVTVPPLAEETWRMQMLSPESQRVSPFFLGGESILVSYPTDAMDEGDKLMSMRGNNVHFARATVFHELIPGHRLQEYMSARYRPYRQMFDTPFWVEGGALYWEFLMWDKGFTSTPEDKVGALFWRMHRCARILFSLKFHLGQMTAAECVDLLVNKVGHERSTAEGEVRRSIAGDYSPLYQAGYMIGAFELRALRHEMVDSGRMSEKTFHDRILQENTMPIEYLRALMNNEPLTKDFKASWRFYPK